MAAASRFADKRDPGVPQFYRAQTTEFLNQVEHHPRQRQQLPAVEGVIDAMGALDRGRVRQSARSRAGASWAGQEMRQGIANADSARADRTRVCEFAGHCAAHAGVRGKAFAAELYGVDTRVDYTGHCLSAMVKLRRQGLELGDSGR